MSRDLRLPFCWNRHPRIVKLRRSLGPAGVLGLIDLWACAKEQQKFFMDLEEIEIASGYSGECIEIGLGLDPSFHFVTVLSELGFVAWTGTQWEILPHELFKQGNAHE